MNKNRCKIQYSNECKPLKQHQRQTSRLTTPKEIQEITDKNHAK